MRYEEFQGPLEGWTYDERGVIHTASGYKTTARQIEFAMWMLECMTSEAKRWMIRSDERPGALRPLYESADLQTAHAPAANSDAPKKPADRKKAGLREKMKKPEREAVGALRAQAEDQRCPVVIKVSGGL